MSPEINTALLDKLEQGDVAAMQQVFVAFEPYLRMLIHRQLSGPLRAKFDSLDIIQSVWADLLPRFGKAGWRFPDTAHLRAFLVRALRNRFLNRIRQYRHAMRCERRLGDFNTDDLPSSPRHQASEVAGGNELWDQMLAVCPPAHRGVLQLKREGMPLAAIAVRTGYHESSVRRILYDLARRFVGKQRGNVPVTQAASGE